MQPLRAERIVAVGSPLAPGGGGSAFFIPEIATSVPVAPQPFSPTSASARRRTIASLRIQPAQSPEETHVVGLLPAPTANFRRTGTPVASSPTGHSATGDLLGMVPFIPTIPAGQSPPVPSFGPAVAPPASPPLGARAPPVRAGALLPRVSDRGALLRAEADVRTAESVNPLASALATKTSTVIATTTLGATTTAGGGGSASASGGGSAGSNAKPKGDAVSGKDNDQNGEDATTTDGPRLVSLHEASLLVIRVVTLVLVIGAAAGVASSLPFPFPPLGPSDSFPFLPEHNSAELRQHDTALGALVSLRASVVACVARVDAVLLAASVAWSSSGNAPLAASRLNAVLESATALRSSSTLAPVFAAMGPSAVTGEWSNYSQTENVDCVDAHCNRAACAARWQAAVVLSHSNSSASRPSSFSWMSSSLSPNTTATGVRRVDARVAASLHDVSVCHNLSSASASGASAAFARPMSSLMWTRARRLKKVGEVERLALVSSALSAMFVTNDIRVTQALLAANENATRIHKLFFAVSDSILLLGLESRSTTPPVAEGQDLSQRIVAQLTLEIERSLPQKPAEGEEEVRTFLFRDDSGVELVSLTVAWQRLVVAAGESPIVIAAALPTGSGDEVPAAAAATCAATWRREQEVKAQTDARSSSVVGLQVAIWVIAAVLCAASGVVAYLVVLPSRVALARCAFLMCRSVDVATIEDADLDPLHAVTGDVSPASLPLPRQRRLEKAFVPRDIAMLQQQCDNLVAILREYKSFLPSSLLYPTQVEVGTMSASGASALKRLSSWSNAATLGVETGAAAGVHFSDGGDDPTVNLGEYGDMVQVLPARAVSPIVQIDVMAETASRNSKAQSPVATLVQTYASVNASSSGSKEGAALTTLGSGVFGGSPLVVHLAHGAAAASSSDIPSDSVPPTGTGVGATVVPVAGHSQQQQQQQQVPHQHSGLTGSPRSAGGDVSTAVVAADQSSDARPPPLYLPQYGAMFMSFSPKAFHGLSDTNNLSSTTLRAPGQKPVGGSGDVVVEPSAPVRPASGSVGPAAAVRGSFLRSPGAAPLLRQHSKHLTVGGFVGGNASAASFRLTATTNTQLTSFSLGGTRSLLGGTGLMSMSHAKVALQEGDVSSFSLRRRNITALICRVFVPNLDAIPVAAVQELSDKFLALVLPVVRNHDGITLRFEALSVTAVWNAFVPHPFHEQHAAICAMDLATEMAHFSVDPVMTRMPSVRWAVCVNSGGALIGDCGSQLRRTPCVVGDFLSFAERVCPLLPSLGTHAVLLEPTYNIARSDVFCVPIDVVGQESFRLTVFEIRSRAAEIVKGDFAWFLDAFSKMCRREFSEARASFLLSSDPQAARLARLCLECHNGDTRIAVLASSERQRRSSQGTTHSNSSSVNAFLTLPYYRCSPGWSFHEAAARKMPVVLDGRTLTEDEAQQVLFPAVMSQRRPSILPSPRPVPKVGSGIPIRGITPVWPGGSFTGALEGSEVFDTPKGSNISGGYRFPSAVGGTSVSSTALGLSLRLGSGMGAGFASATPSTAAAAGTPAGAGRGVHGSGSAIATTMTTTTTTSSLTAGSSAFAGVPTPTTTSFLRGAGAPGPISLSPPPLPSYMTGADDRHRNISSPPLSDNGSGTEDSVPNGGLIGNAVGSPRRRPPLSPNAANALQQLPQVPPGLASLGQSESLSFSARGLLEAPVFSTAPPAVLAPVPTFNNSSFGSNVSSSATPRASDFAGPSQLTPPLGGRPPPSPSSAVAPSLTEMATCAPSLLRPLGVGPRKISSNIINTNSSNNNMSSGIPLKSTAPRATEGTHPSSIFFNSATADAGSLSLTTTTPPLPSPLIVEGLRHATDATPPPSRALPPVSEDAEEPTSTTTMPFLETPSTGAHDEPQQRGRFAHDRNLQLSLMGLSSRQDSTTTATTSTTASPLILGEEDRGLEGTASTMSPTRMTAAMPPPLGHVPLEFTCSKGKVWRRSETVLGRGGTGVMYSGLGDDGAMVAMKFVPLSDSLLAAATKRMSQASLPLRSRALAGVASEESRRVSDPSGVEVSAMGGVSSVDNAAVAEGSGSVVPSATTMKRASSDPGLLRSTAMDGILQEVAQLATLRHEGIVAYVASACVARRLVIVLEFVGGGSLERLLRLFKRIPLAAARCYARDIVQGLAFLHSRQLVHRDVCPSNVLLTVDGRAKLCGFAASTSLLQLSRGGVGTPAYMAPEAARGENPLFAIDVWSMAVTLYVAITGTLPYRTEDIIDVDAATFIERLRSDDSFGPQILEPLEDPAAASFILSCWNRDPTRRPTAAQLALHPFLL